MDKNLPKELTGLVDGAVTTLGDVIRTELGNAKFERIEKIRRFVKSPEGQKLEGLKQLKKDLEKLSSQERFEIAHAFGMMLEIINSCEAAYRAFRLRTQEKEPVKNEKHRFGRVIHVLTAHPTESRSPDVIYYFKKIQDVLEKRLENADMDNAAEFRMYLTWVWRLPMSKQRKPTVMDEAEYIYSLALQKDVIDLYIDQYQEGIPFYIRTWVGGDKDGHPGVDEKTLQGSLQMSRRFILRWMEEKWDQVLKDLEPLAHTAHIGKNDIRKLLVKVKKEKRHLLALKVLKPGDAKRVQKWILQFEELQKAYGKIFHESCEEFKRISMCAKVFPGLVVPLELREDSDLVHEALKSSGNSHAISRMLKTLDKLSPDHDPRFYVRGFVLSHTESVKDILAGIKLVQKFMGQPRLPVVPLFESADALENSVSIITELLGRPEHRNWVKKYWSSKIEVMVGYSDSAKENGSWPSRYLISSGIHKLEKLISSMGFTPIFFHGSGGSIERGGGSVEEQIDWWPQSALDTVKVTVQGEMIYRNYAASEILKKQIARFTEARDHINKQGQLSASDDKFLKRMAESVQNSYRGILEDPHFLDLIELATPYTFMKDLRMGSRPAKRQGAVDLKNLRAIPWVLCWTQTRSLFPTWWGVGSFWNSLNPSEKTSYKKLFKDSSLFRSYIKALGFTIEKIELDIFGLYLFESKLPKDVAQSFYERFQKEVSLSQKAVQEITGQQSMLWYRPWLETSIALRSPLIHPLNVLQLLALRDHDILLLRETVTGVASGMLTTG